MTDFYISDTHFRHANIIKYCNRPFETVKDMDETMIARWNAKVGVNDHVWHLGDFGLLGKDNARNYLQQLNGHKHLLLGNHDHRYLAKMPDLDEFFETVEHATSRKDAQGRRMWLSHYPLAASPRDFWCLYGHIHNSRDGWYFEGLRGNARALNCCVEVNNYEPVTFEELVANNERWRLEG